MYLTHDMAKKVARHLDLSAKGGEFYKAKDCGAMNFAVVKFNCETSKERAVSSVKVAKVSAMLAERERRS